MTKTRSWTKGAGVLGAALLLAVGVLGAMLAAGPAGATLPGANGKIAYANGGIWVAGPGGEDPTRLTASIMDADPGWSPDGTRIAFTRLNGCREPECVFGDVWVMCADSTDARFVTKGFNPSWSPDGERLAYESCATSGFYPCDKRNVGLVNPDRTGRVDLTSGMRRARGLSAGDALTTRNLAGIFVPMAIKVLFVCMGNICRSPVAQGIFEGAVRREGLDGEIEVDSAGTHGFYHAGEMPDPRAQESALARGIDISGQRARLLEPEDCRRFDFILTMDEQNRRAVAGLCGGTAEVRPFLDYAPGPETEVPDPYHGGPEGFQHALDLIERASEGLLREIRGRLPTGRG